MTVITWCLNKTIKLRIRAERSGLDIKYRIYSPLGLFDEGNAIDEGNGLYSVVFTPNEQGIWRVEWIFPDDFILDHTLVVDTHLHTAIEKLEYLRKFLSNRWKIENAKLIVYDDDGVTPIRVFRLLDKEGRPSEIEVYDRIPES